MWGEDEIAEKKERGKRKEEREKRGGNKKKEERERKKKPPGMEPFSLLNLSLKLPIVVLDLNLSVHDYAPLKDFLRRKKQRKRKGKSFFKKPKDGKGEKKERKKETVKANTRQPFWV